MIGQLIDGRYRIVKLLSTVTIGKIYLAADTHRPGYPQCIAKQIRPSGKNARMLAVVQGLWRKKAEQLEKLGKHDRIPQLLAFFQEENFLYLIEEAIEGKPLSEELVAGKPLSPESTIALLREILEILHFVRDSGLLHGNVRPSNLIRRASDGKLMLIGFDSFQQIGATSGEEAAIERPEKSNGARPHPPPLPASRNGELSQAEARKNDRADRPDGTLSDGKGDTQQDMDLYAVGTIGIQALAGIAWEEIARLYEPQTRRMLWRDRLSFPEKPEDDEEAIAEWEAQRQKNERLADLCDALVAPAPTERIYQKPEEVLAELDAIDAIVPPDPEEITRIQIDLNASPPETSALPETDFSAPDATSSPTPSPTAWQRSRQNLTRLLTSRWAIAGGIALLVLALLYGLYRTIGNPFAPNADSIATGENANPQNLLVELSKALNRNDRDPKLYYERGNVRHDLGDLEAAIADYSKAIELDPSNSNAYYNRGLTHYDLGQYSQAVRDFDRVLKLDASDSEAYYKRGLARHELGDYATAIADYTEALRSHPTDADMFVSRGLARSASGDKVGAIEDYTLALKIDPSNTRALYSRGRARFHLGDYEGAEADYDRTISLEPKNVEAYTNRCGGRINLFDYAGALQDCTEAIRLDSKNATAYANRCVVNYNLKSYPAAIVDCTQAISLQPDKASHYNNRGLARQAAGDPTGAIADYTEAARINPKDSIAYSNRAQVHVSRQEYDKAIEDYAQAIRFDPEYGEAYYRRALLRLQLGEDRGARDDLQKAAKFCLDRGLAGCYNSAQQKLQQLQEE